MSTSNKILKCSIPVIVTKNTAAFSGSTMSIVVHRPTSLRAITALVASTLEAKKNNKSQPSKICLVAQKSSSDINDTYTNAVLCTVTNITLLHTGAKSNKSEQVSLEDLAEKSQSNLFNNDASETDDLNKSASDQAIPDYNNMLVRIVVNCQEQILMHHVQNVYGYQELCQYEIVEEAAEDAALIEQALSHLRTTTNKYLQILDMKYPHQKERLERIRKALANDSLSPIKHINLIATFLYNDDPSVGEDGEDEAATLGRIAKGQKVLAEKYLTQKAKLITQEIDYRIADFALEGSINSQTEEELKKDQYKAILRKKIEIIRKNLGDSPGALKDKYKKVLPYITCDEDMTKINDEINRLDHISPYSSEYSTMLNYLDFVYKLYRKQTTRPRFDLRQARHHLNQGHFGLEKIKQTIISHFNSARYVVQDNKGSPRVPQKILCFIGPPGVGKTSIAQSIAHAFNLPYTVIAMGGVKDEAEIRGHRKTYIGAMAGKILQGISSMPTRPGIIIIDEVDKIASASNNGDPTAALLEVLDPSQNHAFKDHYLGLKYDLSQYTFILTANYPDNIPAPLMDRIEKIHLSGYSEQEKLAIAKSYILPKLGHGYNLLFETDNNNSAGAVDDIASGEPNNTDAPQLQHQITISDEALSKIIYKYTREAGVRELQRCVQSLIAKKILYMSELVDEANHKGEFLQIKGLNIEDEDIEKYLGPHRVHREHELRDPTIGVVNGLSYSAAGGGVLPIEVIKLPGEGKVLITGRQGEVMKESVNIGHTVAMKALNNTDPDVVKQIKKNWDLHIHVPEGAVPKDGPSAGAAFATAIYSAYTDTPVSGTAAMTGELTLSDDVNAIGGVKEKVLAAIAAKMKMVILPKANAKDVNELIEEKIFDRDVIQFEFVKNIKEVFDLVLPPKAPINANDSKENHEVDELPQGPSDIPSASIDNTHEKPVVKKPTEVQPSSKERKKPKQGKVKPAAKDKNIDVKPSRVRDEAVKPKVAKKPAKRIRTK